MNYTKSTIGVTLCAIAGGLGGYYGGLQGIISIVLVHAGAYLIYKE